MQLLSEIFFFDKWSRKCQRKKNNDYFCNLE